MGKAPCCSKAGLRKGPWSNEEDMLLTKYIEAHGEGQWRYLPHKAGLLRCGKSCRLRWMNYLRPGIKRGNITPEEDELIIRLHSLLGNRWSLIAGRLPGRTDNEIKNYWNTHLLKKLRDNAVTDPKNNIVAAVAKMPKQSKNNTKKKQKKQKQKQKKNASSNDSNNKEEEAAAAATKMKVYAPKPIMLLPRTTFSISSNNKTAADSSSSRSSSNKEIHNLEAHHHHHHHLHHHQEDNMLQYFDHEEQANADISRFISSLIELGDNAKYGDIQVDDQDYDDDDDDQVLIDVERNFSLQDSIPEISSMLEKVYDEYLQLL